MYLEDVMLILLILIVGIGVVIIFNIRMLSLI